MSTYLLTLIDPEYILKNTYVIQFLSSKDKNFEIMDR